VSRKYGYGQWFPVERLRDAIQEAATMTTPIPEPTGAETRDGIPFEPNDFEPWEIIAKHLGTLRDSEASRRHGALMVIRSLSAYGWTIAPTEVAASDGVTVSRKVLRVLIDAAEPKGMVTTGPQTQRIRLAIQTAQSALRASAPVTTEGDERTP
jgi:hypothetical protein